MVDIMGVSRKPFKISGKRSYYYKLHGRRLSLSTANYSEACSLLSEIKTAFLKGKVKQITGECDKAFGQFKDEYEEWAVDTQPDKTFKANRLALRKIEEIEGRHKRLDMLTMKTMDELKRRNRKLKPTSINNYIRHSKAVMNKAVDWGYLKENPFKGAKELPKGRRVEFIDPAKLTEFINGIEDLDVRQFVAACLATGRRRSEIFRMSWEDILWDVDKYFIAKEKRHLCKTYPMNASFRAVLKSIPQGKGRIFNRWSHADTYTHQVKKAMKAAGLGHLRLHDLRHSFSVAFLEAGGSLKELQDALGQSEFRITSDTYAHITDDALENAVNLVKLGPLDLFPAKKK